jgi:hypothetical protein
MELYWNGRNENASNSTQNLEKSLGMHLLNGLCVLQGVLAQVTRISLTELQSGNIQVLPESLVKDGVLIIEDSIDTTKVSRLSSGISNCIGTSRDFKSDFSVRSTFDGSLRATFATRSNEPFGDCDHDTEVLAQYFKDQTQLIGVSVARLLSFFLDDRSSQTLRDHIEDVSSDSLDHFHVYSRPDISDSEPFANTESTVSIPFHFDMGLFLVVTPEVWISDSSRNIAHSDLIVKRWDGTEVRVVPANPNSVIILIGSAIPLWLRPNIPINPCLHAVVPSASPQTGKRVVLGRMFLPRMDALSPSGVAFRDFFTAPLRRAEPAESKQRQWRRLTESECESGTKMCWMQCMPDIDCGDQESVCKDPAEDRECGPDECNTRCTLMCPERKLELTPDETSTSASPNRHVVPFKRVALSTSASPTEFPQKQKADAAVPVARSNRFCYGATSMVMSGFESVTSEKASCIILFFRPWLLDTPLKFAIGCIGVFLLGFLIEGAIKLRRYATNVIQFKKTWTRELAVTSLFGLNVAFGYLAMLAAMTFNVEIFISTVMGLAVGHLMFANSKQPVRETADPCCVTTEASVAATLGVETSLRNSTGACCCDR